VDDSPGDKDSGAGDDEAHKQRDEEDSDGDAPIDNRVSSRAASNRGQSEGDTEDDPVGPMTPGPTDSRTGEPTNNAATNSTCHQRFTHHVRRRRRPGRRASDEGWVDSTPIPVTPLDATPPLFTSTTASSVGAGAPMAATMVSKTKSSGSTKGHKRQYRSHRVRLGLRTTDRDTADGHTARGHDGGQWQSGGVKGVIALKTRSGIRSHSATIPVWDQLIPTSQTRTTCNHVAIHCIIGLDLVQRAFPYFLSALFIV
jgi:cysteine protease ATG4